MVIFSLVGLKSFLVALTLLASACAAPVSAELSKRAAKEAVTNDFHPQQSQKFIANDHDAAFKIISDLRSKGQVPKEVFINSTNTVITDIRYDDETTPEAFSFGGIVRHFWPGAGKVIPGIHWNERQVNSQGTYFTPWVPASCPFYNDKSTSDVRHDFTTTLTKTTTYTPGFDLNFGGVAALKIGAEITKTNTLTRLDSFTIKAGANCQLWVRPLRLWQNQQTRSCVKSGLSGPTTCSGWSAVIHGDFLVQNKTIPNLWCGAGNIRPNNCGT